METERSERERDGVRTGRCTTAGPEDGGRGPEPGSAGSLRKLGRAGTGFHVEPLEAM